MNFQNKIENILSSNASEFEISKVIKSKYRDYLSSLKTDFEKSSGKYFLIKHTKSIDDFLKIIYKVTINKTFENYSPRPNTLPITLLALGSYAREQMCVHSDIDLMIVYRDIKGYNIKEIIESLLSLAWDSGLKLGHRVHEIDELLKASRSDHTIKSAMIESRFIHGSKPLWYETQMRINYIKKDDQLSFIQAKLDEYSVRHNKYPIELRANIKDGSGGLRDINAVYWIGSVLHNNIRSVKDLVPIIDEQKYITLIKSVDFLFRVRIALHISSGKKIDTLRLELIPDIAKILNQTQIGVAKKIYKALFEIDRISELFIYELISTQFPIQDDDKLVLNEDIYIINDKLYANYKEPQLNLTLLEILELVLKHHKKIDNYHITFIEYLSNIKHNFSPKDSFELMQSILQNRAISNLLFAIYKAKQLFYIFPPLKKIRYLPQFDGYHKYPVDIHSILTLKSLENIEDIFVLQLYQSLTTKEVKILHLTSLLHDSGKGRKRDHSELGSLIVKEFAKEIDFSKDEAQMAYRLVRHHTLMSNTSAREDIYNEKIIYTFNAKIETVETLKLLYILTYADISSVGKSTYSSFNSNLLKELYENSLEAFSNKKMITEAARRVKLERALKKYPLFKELKKSTQKKILSIKSNLLFFKYTPYQITVLAKKVEDCNKDYRYNITTTSPLTIEILSKVDINLGYLLTKLSYLDITTLDIFKIESGLKYFKIAFNEEIGIDQKLPIEEIILDSFDMNKKASLPTLDIKIKEIDIDCNHSKSYARMKLNAKDQKGLLANVVSIFDDMGIDIASSKIQTIKNRARNLFLIEKNGNFCNAIDEIIKKLVK